MNTNFILNDVENDTVIHWFFIIDDQKPQIFGAFVQ